MTPPLIATWLMGMSLDARVRSITCLASSGTAKRQDGQDGQDDEDDSGGSTVLPALVIFVILSILSPAVPRTVAMSATALMLGGRTFRRVPLSNKIDIV